MPSTVFLRIGATVYHYKDKHKGKGTVLRFVESLHNRSKSPCWYAEIQWETGEIELVAKGHCRAFPDKKSRKDAQYRSHGRISEALRNKK